MRKFVDITKFLPKSYVTPKRFLVRQEGFDDDVYLEDALSVALHLARLFGKCDDNMIDVPWVEKVEKQAEKLKLFEEISDPLTGIHILRVGF